MSDEVSVSDSVDESDPGTAIENASNEGDHEEGSDYICDNSAVTRIFLGGASVSITGEGATSRDGKVMITSAGTYVLSGTLTDGQIMVSIEDKGIVRLILDGVNVSCSKGSPLYVAGAGKAVIILADNKETAFQMPNPMVLITQKKASRTLPFSARMILRFTVTAHLP